MSLARARCRPERTDGSDQVAIQSSPVLSISIPGEISAEGGLIDIVARVDAKRSCSHSPMLVVLNLAPL